MEEDKELEQLIPQMNVTVPAEQEQGNIVSGEMWLGICDEILNNLRQDRQEIEEIKNNFVEMVINDGDSTSASKEALTKLVELKVGVSEKMTKVLDLAGWVMVKDTFPKYLATQQNDSIDGGKREFLKQVNKMLQKKKKE